MDSYLIGAGLLLLTALSFYAGRRMQAEATIDQVLATLLDQKIIRMEKNEEGDTEIYSGTHFFKG